jgi:hypothetical protein
LDEANFPQIDSLSRRIEYKNDLSKLTYELTKDYPGQLDKARAIFIWITDNIAYDYKAFNKHKIPKDIHCKSSDDCDAKRAASDDRYIDQVISKHKGVCQGYAMLFQKMCGYAGIQCSVVPGYVKTEPYELGKMGPLDHAWNAVVIDGNYYFLDATWAAGGVTVNKKGKLNGFVKDFDPYYWLTPLDKFSRNHFPKDSIWQARAQIAKSTYRDQPFIMPSLLKNLQVIEPARDKNEFKLGDTIHFKIDYRRQMEKLQVNTNISRNPSMWIEQDGQKIVNERTLPKQKYVPFRREGSLYYFDYVVTENNLAYINVLFDYDLAVRLKVKVVE